MREVNDAHLPAIAHDAEHLAPLRALAPTSIMHLTSRTNGRAAPHLASTTRRSDAPLSTPRTREAILATVLYDLMDPLDTMVLAAGVMLDQRTSGNDAHAVERRPPHVIERVIERVAVGMRRLVADPLPASALGAGRLR